MLPLSSLLSSLISDIELSSLFLHAYGQDLESLVNVLLNVIALPLINKYLQKGTIYNIAIFIGLFKFVCAFVLCWLPLHCKSLCYAKLMACAIYNITPRCWDSFYWWSDIYLSLHWYYDRLLQSCCRCRLCSSCPHVWLIRESRAQPPVKVYIVLHVETTVLLFFGACFCYIILILLFRGRSSFVFLFELNCFLSSSSFIGFFCLQLS